MKSAGHNRRYELLSLVDFNLPPYGQRGFGRDFLSCKNDIANSWCNQFSLQVAACNLYVSNLDAGLQSQQAKLVRAPPLHCAQPASPSGSTPGP